MTGFGSIVGIESPSGLGYALEQTMVPNAAQAFRNPYRHVNIRYSPAHGKQPQAIRFEQPANLGTIALSPVNPFSKSPRKRHE
jgi:hypothetical protein